MKTVIENERRPRKYTPMTSLYLCDDRGITWGIISVREGSISIRTLQGVDVHPRTSEALGYWDLDKESDRPWIHRSKCPDCQDTSVIYDPLTYVVKCQGCGRVY